MSTDQTLHCPTCGYNLTGLPENRCPECGKRFSLERLKRFPNPSVFLELFLAGLLLLMTLLMSAAGPIAFVMG